MAFNTRKILGFHLDYAKLQDKRLSSDRQPEWSSVQFRYNSAALGAAQAQMFTTTQTWTVPKDTYIGRIDANFFATGAAAGNRRLLNGQVVFNETGANVLQRTPLPGFAITVPMSINLNVFRYFFPPGVVTCELTPGFELFIPSGFALSFFGEFDDSMIVGDVLWCHFTIYFKNTK